MLTALSLSAQASETVTIPAVQIEGVLARPAPAPLTGRLFLPSGDAKAPLVILLHTCGGVDRTGHLEGWADRLNDWGYAALVLDSFTVRGVAYACAGNKADKVTPGDQAGDAINAAMALRAHPRIDGSRIGVVGFSFGGNAAVTVTRKGFQRAQPGLIKASVAYYGTCVGPEAHAPVPLLILAGDRDDWGAPPVTCRKFVDALPAGMPVDMHIYSGVFHSFDQTSANPGRSIEGHRVQYDYDAARDSYGRTRAFLDQYVKNAK